MTKIFLLEVGLEDMPAGVILNAENQLVEKTKRYLEEANLTFGEVNGYSTPRRFSVIVKDVAEKQPDERLTVRGPAKRIAQDEEGNWTKAAIGFSKGQGGSVDNLIIKEEKGEPYIFIEKFTPGKTALEILQGMDEVIRDIEFPKNMKWGNSSYHYVRPIHWIVALLGEEVVPFEVFDVETGKVSEGHRFLGHSVEITAPEKYETLLKEQAVIPNRSERQAMIVEQINDLCEMYGWLVPAMNSELLEEVTDLVEYPTAFYGKFDESYLELPEVVLETSMIDHQRYFPVRDAKGKQTLLPYFISVRNGNSVHIDNVSRGNEKVLSARLADGKFFYLEDQKMEISDFVDKLKNVDYHEQLGTIYDKQNRAIRIVDVIGDNFKLSNSEMNELKEIAAIYKFDLVTQIVDEFPTLQGTIGGIYAKEHKMSDEISAAISEQYMPLSQIDQLPESKLGKYIALIDKLDTLIQFFSIGLIPTGSNDPHALRRQAIGVVRLILDLDEKQLDLMNLINEIVEVSELPKKRLNNLNKNMLALNTFILDRLEQIMRTEHNLSHDVRQAVLAANHENLTRIIEAGDILERQKNQENYKSLVESITRVLNITKSNGTAGQVNDELVETESEKELVEAVFKLSKVFNQTTDLNKWYDGLEEISPMITEFFEQNMVMVDQQEVKENRLTLLNNLAKITKQFADFGELII